MRSPQQPHPRFAPSVLWRCSPSTTTESQEVTLSLCAPKKTDEAFRILINWGMFFRAYQHLNVFIVLGDTLDVSWVLPGGEANSIKSAAAQNQTCCKEKAQSCFWHSGGLYSLSTQGAEIKTTNHIKHQCYST